MRAAAAAAAAMAMAPAVAPAASAASAAPVVEESLEEELASRAQNREKKARDFSSIMTSAMAEKKGGRREDQGEKFGEAKEGDQFGVVWGKPEEENPETTEVVEVEKANFGLSGALAHDEKTGSVLNGVTLKFQEPADSRVPDKKGPRWRFYVFRGDEMLETIERSVEFYFEQDARLVQEEVFHNDFLDGL